jgi:glycine C-acetyltransferase
MTKSFLTYLNSELKELRNTGLYKSERVIASKQAGTVALESGRQVINLCANNYLGLSDNAELIEAGRAQTQFHGPFTLDH